MKKGLIYIASFLLLVSFLTKMGEGLFTGFSESKVFIENSCDEKKEVEKEKNGVEDKISYGLSADLISLSASLLTTDISVKILLPGFKNLPFLPPDIA